MSEGFSIARELMQVHEGIERLIVEADAAPAGPERLVLVHEAAARCLRDVLAEERVLLPALRTHLPDGGRLAAEFGARQRTTALTVERLAGDRQDADFEAAFAQLVATFAEHAAALDAGVLSTLSDACPPEEMNHLGRRIRAVYADVPGEPLAARAQVAARGAAR